ncbi:MAG: hypothetical protein FJZ78_04610 [Bacteroidetes bacterium]|nr:hypothetical protein [Bacteroidota bacterium]
MNNLLILNLTLVPLHQHLKICVTTTTTMKYDSVTVDTRLLDSLNYRQMEVTLAYIQKVLAERPKAEKDRIKENAIRQIRFALESSEDQSHLF